MRMTPEEYKAFLAKNAPKKPAKYRNIKKFVNGIEFDSAKEARRYQDLLIWQETGQITKLETHRAFPLVVNGVHVCDYESDFCYQPNGGSLVVEDAKSKVTRKLPVYRLKKKLMAAVYAIEIQEV